MINKITKTAVIAGLYIALCMVFAPISYGVIQCRIGEMLKVLPFYNKKYAYALILGVMIVNIFSPLGFIDVAVGLCENIILFAIITRLKTKRYIAPVTAVIIGVFVGCELYFVLGLPIVISILSVAAGEFIAVQIGVFIFAGIEKMNKSFADRLRKFI